jgi:hypothetical protein
MTTEDLLKIRLFNQRLAGNEMKRPHEVVSYMGAMQSQVFDMARWAIGTRLKGATNRTVEEAINTARIIRVHILRPTWHFVAAEDIYWMQGLSMPRLRPVYASYARMSGIDESIPSKVWPWIEKTLRDGNHLTKEELTDRLTAERIQADVNTVTLTLTFAEQEGWVCNGRIIENKQTFCLLQEWVPGTQTLSKEESLEKLARKFFTSHSPATLQDFIWWSGLLISDARKALDLIKDDFISEEINGRSFWMKSNNRTPCDEKDSALLLPQFDEMVVSYKDRSEMIADKHYGKVMTKNGIFSPTIMLNGEIIGSWRKAGKKNKPEVELSFFEKTSKAKQELFKQEKKAYLGFLTGE